MTKTIGPLFSASAHGKLGDLLQYQDGKSARIVRSQKAPSQPHTAAQEQQRAYYRTALDAWLSRAKNEYNGAAWNRSARELGKGLISINAYMRYALNAQVDGKTWVDVSYRLLASGGPSDAFVSLLDTGIANPPVIHSGRTPFANEQTDICNHLSGFSWDALVGPYPTGTKIFFFAVYDVDDPLYGRTGLQTWTIG